MEPVLRVAMQVGAGAVGSALVATQAYRLRALTRSGAWAAVACGTVLYGAGGWPWAALVGTFFATSSALTRLEPGAGTRARRSADVGGRRWDQVAANGGLAAVTAVLYGLTGSPTAFAAAAGAVATATADTWGTEAGRWSPAPPRLIITGSAVPHGTSGGITALGTLGTVAGALLIGWLGAEIARPAGAGPFAAAVTAAGVSGAFLDSLLGATVEGRWRWVGNSTVNFVATAWGAAAAAGAMLLWR